MGHYSSFILRLWVDAQDGRRWGLIQHVTTREKCRFSDFSEMLEFIRKHSGEDDPAHFSLDGLDDPLFDPSDFGGTGGIPTHIREDEREKNP